MNEETIKFETSYFSWTCTIPEISDALQSSTPLATEASREAHLRGYGICETCAHTWGHPRCSAMCRSANSWIFSDFVQPSLGRVYDPRSRFYEFVRKKRLRAESTSILSSYRHRRTRERFLSSVKGIRSSAIRARNAVLTNDTTEKLRHGVARVSERSDRDTNWRR